MDIVHFWTICSTNNINLTKDTIDTLQRYANELKYWNEKINLISRKDEENILERHILHSLAICKYHDFLPKDRVLDIGTGGGLPGIPIKIVNPEINIDLIDSIGKKSKMTTMFAQHTGLKNIWVHNDRVENYLDSTNIKYNVVVARAVTRTINILDWCEGHTKKDCVFLLLKGGDLREEIEDAKDKYPRIKVEVIDIDFLGFDYFKEQEKKLIIIKGF